MVNTGVAHWNTVPPISLLRPFVFGRVRKLPAFGRNSPILFCSNHQDTDPGIRGGYVPVERSLFIQILSYL